MIDALPPAPGGHWQITPARLYSTHALMVLAEANLHPLEVQREKLSVLLQGLEPLVKNLEQIRANFGNLDNQMSRRRVRPDGLPVDDSDSGLVPIEMSFIQFVSETLKHIQTMAQQVDTTLSHLMPRPRVLLDHKVPDLPQTADEFQILGYQLQMNQGAIMAFVEGHVRAEHLPADLQATTSALLDLLNKFRGCLIRRHQSRGVQIHDNPVMTDLAQTIFNNVDSDGEVDNGTDPSKVSAYSIERAKLLLDAVMGNSLLFNFAKDPFGIIGFILGTLNEFDKIVTETEQGTRETLKGLRLLYAVRAFPAMHGGSRDLFPLLEGADPARITYREPERMLTAEERHSLEEHNATLNLLVNQMRAGFSSEDIIISVLERKADRRKHDLEVNSFYVCQISAGNPFSGDAPGALSVVPGIKPAVDLSDVVGSGFDEVRQFIGHTLDGAKWHDLFVATSPSKKSDKSNILLVGPQGSGKTEVLRGVASDKRSLGIFAQASDFLTCWKGEAEKNPKRLFEAGLKLQRQSGKQVFFLLDEIDTILNGDRGQAAFGGTNLASEFQILMDGITAYPNLCLWGATNHPERIPMPLIRRFARVLIVGELSDADRVLLLQRFLGTLPWDDSLANGVWGEVSTQLNGAVGDTVRKVADHVWRTKMGHFVQNHPLEAEQALKILNDGTIRFDVRKFPDDRRRALHSLLRPFTAVSAADIRASVDLHLGNMAIREEIRTATETYARAHKFLSDYNAGGAV